MPSIPEGTRPGIPAFARSYLSKEHWPDTTRCNINWKINPDHVFAYFSEKTNKSTGEIRAEMIEAAINSKYDLHDVCGTSMSLKSTDVTKWIDSMKRPTTPGDEFAIYMLSRMSFLHAFMLSDQSIWTTLEVTKPPTIRDMMRDCKIHLVYMGKRLYTIIRKIPPLHAARSTSNIVNQRQMYQNQNSMFAHSATFVQSGQRRPLNLVATRGCGNSTSRGQGRYNPLGMLPVQTRTRQTRLPNVMFCSVTNVLNPAISESACEVSSPEVADVLASLKGKKGP